MKLRYLIIGAIGFVVGWNVFLIQRDQQLFESYNQPSQSERMQ
jgi:hypothetical protein